MIEVKNLVKRYGDHVAVDRLNFTVEEGQIYGFLGPNGAGKSTTMNIITGYLAATEGEVTINGHNILEEPEEAKKCIGYLPEIPPLYMDMTVTEYLKFAAELKKIPKEKREKHIKEIMSLVKITDMKPPDQKSLEGLPTEGGTGAGDSAIRRLLFWMSRRWAWIRNRLLRSVI